MSISVERAYRLQRDYITSIDSVMVCAKADRSTHKRIIDRLAELLYDDANYKKLPVHRSEYIRGYLAARMGELYRYELEWRMWVNVSPGDYDLLCKVHSNGTHVDADIKKCYNLLTRRQIDELRQMPQFENIWSNIDSDKSAHVWKGYPNKPFSDKPNVETSD